MRFLIYLFLMLIFGSCTQTINKPVKNNSVSLTDDQLLTLFSITLSGISGMVRNPIQEWRASGFMLMVFIRKTTNK